MRRIIALIALVAIILAGAVISRSESSSAANATAAATIDSLASPAAPGSAEPNLAVAADGRVYMSWLEPADSGHALRFAVLNGKQWSAAQTIRAGRDFFVNWADFPSIEVLDDGRLAAHWLQRNGSATYAYGVRISQSADGGKTWSTPVMPHDSSQTEHGFVAMWRENGKLGAVWLDGRKFSKEGHDAANEMMLVSTTIDPSGKPGAETRLDERTCDCCQNTAAMTADGPIIAYRDRSPNEIRDIHVTRRVGGKWTAGVPAHSDNWKIAACPVNGPAIAASGRRVALAWFTAANDSARVKLAFSDDAGATFGAPFRVDGGNPAGRVDVALLQDGGARPPRRAGRQGRNCNDHCQVICRSREWLPAHGGHGLGRSLRMDAPGASVSRSCCPRPAFRFPVMNANSWRVAVTAIAVVIAVSACASPDATRKVEVGTPAPAYKTVSLDGDSVSLGAQHGKVVLLNVWATWCHPCRDEIPELRQLHAKYKDRGLELVGVSIDADGSDDAIRAFMKDFAMEYPIWRDPDERVSTQFLVIGPPTTFLIDRDGILRWMKLGPIQPQDSSLTAAIERALGS